MFKEFYLYFRLQHHITEIVWRLEVLDYSPEIRENENDVDDDDTSTDASQKTSILEERRKRIELWEGDWTRT